ncbi:hypothetical protein AAU57_08410 [Nonlabens sp. YIK11]|uniref:trypsin-like peptidase domain-containing protein n=1 Tax=Nonlabens sp. YIK11 TaxID=1453349 RepID=UPI0006DC0C62|nr:trypsin-like peptidase domain-containing protein [Nonlabens sp. YIK11]KQC33333.1 hypothetical protein AAU57_08410 [Nonlabens sp. YIK11]
MKQPTYLYLLLLLFIVPLLGIAQDTEIPLPKENPFAEPGTDSRGVFGTDDRKEVNDVSGIDHYTRATAVMIPKDIVVNGRIYGYTLKQRLSRQFGTSNISNNVKFQEQPTVANCTGFLVTPDILVSAGHCILDLESAQDYYWLFDYTDKMKYNPDGYYIEYDDNDLFEVVEVLDGKLEGEGEYSEDYVVMKLDRKTGRLPYRIRTSGAPEVDRTVYTIGSPTGLPLKISTNSKVVDSDIENWFKTDIDAFPGNSGGPVFDYYGWIEGILVRGAVEYANGVYTGDYKYDSDCDCVQTVTFRDANWNAGCQVHKINKINYDLIYRFIYDNLEHSIETNNLAEFNRWSSYNWIFKKQYTIDRDPLENVLMRAASRSMTLDQSTMLQEMIKYNTGNYGADFEKRLVEFVFNYQFEPLKEAAAEYLNLDVATNGETVLWDKVKGNQKYQVNDLLVYGANYNLTDAYNNNLLHLSAQNGNKEMAQLFIDKGVSLEKENNRGWRPEKVAKKAGYKDLSKWLKKERKRRD